MGLINKGVFSGITGTFFPKNALVPRNKDKIWSGD